MDQTLTVISNLLKLFHGPDSQIQRGLPYNHVRFVSHYDVALVTRIHEGDRPIRDRYNFIEDQHWQLMCMCWTGNPHARPTVEAVQCAL